MTLAFLNLGGAEVLLIVLALFFIIALFLGNYGKNTIFGYWGSVLLAIFTTPLIAFAILTFLKYKAAKS